MSDAATLIKILDLPLHDRLTTPVLVKVQSGQTVSQLLVDFYGVGYGSKGYQLALAQLMRQNPWLINPNQVKPGQLLKLMPLPKPHAIAQAQLPNQFDPIAFGRTSSLGRCYACEPVAPNYDQSLVHHIPNNPKELEAFQALAWFHDSWPVASTAVGSGMSSLGMITGERNSTLITQVKAAYEELKRGRITENQYNYIRKKSLDVLQKKLGPMEKLLFKGKTAHEAIRIVRNKAIPATDEIVSHAARFSKLAKLATNGNIVLGIVGVGMTCWDIHDTDNRQKQNEIFVESLASGFAGYFAGLLTLTLVAGPLGIGVALVLSCATAGVAMGTGKFFGNYYTTSGSKLDLVGALGVRSLCHR